MRVAVQRELRGDGHVRARKEEKSERRMPRLSGGEEGRGKLRKTACSCKQTLIRRYPNGATRQAEGLSSDNVGGERGELKHLSTHRKRKKMIDTLSRGD